MQESTNRFLTRIKDSSCTTHEHCKASFREAQSDISTELRDVQELLIDLQEIEFDEDPTISGVLEEYRQKLGAMERTAKDIREKITRFYRIKKELIDLERRVGAPLRETGEIPVTIHTNVGRV